MKREWKKPSFTELSISSTEAVFNGPGSDGVLLDVVDPTSGQTVGKLPGGS